MTVPPPPPSDLPLEPPPPECYAGTLCAAGGDLDGFVEQLTSTTVHLQLLGGLPVPDEQCRLELQLPVGVVVAQVRVVDLNRPAGTCELELLHIESNGAALLAACLLSDTH